MKVRTVCLRCHQKCHLTAEVVAGKVVAVTDARSIYRTPACVEACPIGIDVPGYVIAHMRDDQPHASKFLSMLH